MSGRGTRTSGTDTETNNFFFFVIRRETELLPLLMRDGHPVGWPFFMCALPGANSGKDDRAHLLGQTVGKMTERISGDRQEGRGRYAHCFGVSLSVIFTR